MSQTKYKKLLIDQDLFLSFVRKLLDNDMGISADAFSDLCMIGNACQDNSNSGQGELAELLSRVKYQDDRVFLPLEK